MKILLIGANNPETLRMIKAVSRSTPNIEFIGFIDNDIAKIGKTFLGLPVLSGSERVDDSLLKECFFVNLITRDAKTRYQVSRQIFAQGGRFTNFIHPSVDCDMTKMGIGNYIQEAVVIQAGVELGNNSSIHIGAMVGHETTIGHSSFVAHGCNLSGFTRVGDGVFLGAGVTTVPRVSIGNWSVIGAGAVVTKDIPPFSIAVGNPARVIKTVEPVFDSGDISK